MPGALSTTPEALITTRGLSRRFGALVAVDEVDLEVRRGEVYGFLGPNGAGKSTLIRMLIGLLVPSSGSVEVMGYELPRQADALRPHVGYMTQKFSLYDDLSVEENLDFAAEIFGLGRAERRQRVAEALADYRLEDRRRQRPATLSGGWKQRLALAASTIHRPQLLLLDEPTAGVDPANRRLFWAKLFDLAAEGTTILVSTHYMDEAVRCHRLCMLIRGRRVATGQPALLTAALDDRVVEIRAEPIRAAIRALRELPDVVSVTQLGNRGHALLQPGSSAGRFAPILLEHLRQEGLSEPSAEVSEPSLEDVFVAVSLGEKLGEEAG